MAEYPVAEVEDLYSYYSQMMDSVTDYAVIRLDGAGVVRSWHAGAQQLTEYAAEEIIGRPIAQFYTAEDVAIGLADSDLGAAAKAGRHQTEGWRVRKDGSQFWAAVVFTAVHDGDGTSGYGMVVRDLSERREQELTLRSLEQMVNSIADYEVIRFDLDGLIRSWNQGAQTLTGYTADEVVGHKVSMFYTAEDARSDMLEREKARAVRDGSLEVEGWRIRKDGTRFWANIVLSPTPVVPPATTRACLPAAATPVVPPAPRRVLYVDDNPQLTGLVERIFAADPAVAVQTAPDGATGISLAIAQPPDIVLLDLHLSDMSGEALLRQLRADARTWSIPAIIVSGDTSPDTIERLIGLGAAAYLIKPFTSAQLRELIAATGRAAHASPAHVAS